MIDVSILFLTVRKIYPDDDKTNFLSILKFYDAINSGFNLISAAYTKCINILSDEIILPILKEYLIKPINIFDNSINNRANSIINIIDKISGYQKVCSDDENANALDQYKCLVYSYSKEYLDYMFCGYDDEENEDYNRNAKADDCDGLKKLREAVSDFTKPEVNISYILIDKYHLPEAIVLPILRLVADITNPQKNYNDILKSVSNLYEEGTYAKGYIDNVSRIIDFFSNINGQSNFKSVLDYLNIPNSKWDSATKFVKEVSENRPLCNNSFIGYDYEYEYVDGGYKEIRECHIETNILHYASVLISKNTTEEIIGSISKIIADYAIPMMKIIDKPLSTFLNSGYDTMLKYFNSVGEDDEPIFKENLKLSSTQFIKQTGQFLTNLFSLVDKLIPYVAKEIPYVNEFYPKGQEIINNFNNVFTNDQNIASLLNTFYNGLGVVTDIIKSVGDAWKDESTIEELVKAVKPTSFLNAYQTALEISKYDNLTLHKLAKAITYDGSNSVAKLLAEARTLSINDVAPAKTLILHSNDLANDFQSYDLKLSTVATALGTTNAKLIGFINMFVQPIVASPYNVIRNNLAHYFKTDGSGIDAILNRLNLLFKSMASLQNIEIGGGAALTYVPTPTPMQTAEPVIDTTIKKPDFIQEEITINPNDDKETTNNKIKDAIKEHKKDPNKEENKPTVLTINNDELKCEDLDLISDEFIKLNNDATVTYTSGNLNLYLGQESTSVKIAVENSDVKMSIMNEQESTVKITTTNKDVKEVKITAESEVSAPLTVVVPDHVDSVKIETVNLHSTSLIKAQKDNENNDPVTIDVNKLVANTGTQAKLNKVVISKELTIETNAKIELDDVSFSKDSNLNLNMRTYNTGNYREAMITGILKSPPAKISLNPPSNANAGPDHSAKYVLLQGQFENTCQAWKDVLDVKGANFDDSECTDSAWLAEDKAIVAFKNGPKKKDDGKNKNKLGPGPIAGIVVGCVAAVAIVVVVVVIVIKKKKNSKNKSSDENGKDDDAEL